MSTFTIETLKPGRVLDGHVHDLLGVPEPVWPYSTHPNSKQRLREWLKKNGVTISLPGQGRASDDCVVLVRGLRHAFAAVSENHALCLGVLLALSHGGRPENQDRAVLRCPRPTARVGALAFSPFPSSKDMGSVRTPGGVKGASRVHRSAAETLDGEDGRVMLVGEGKGLR